MSSQSDDVMSCGVCSQDSNANAPSASGNTPIPEFGSLCLADHGQSSRWQPLEDSDYDSDNNAYDGKRKQRSQDSYTEVQQKKLKKDEQMECQEVDTDSHMQSENTDDSQDREADNEEEESGEECVGAYGQEPEMSLMDDGTLTELPSVSSLPVPSTSGMKRRNYDKLDSSGVPKVKKSKSDPELNNKFLM